MSTPVRAVILACCLLVASACATTDTDDDVAAGAPSPSGSERSRGALPSPSPVTRPADTPSPDPTSAPADAAAVPDLAETCTIDPSSGAVDTIRLAYPQGWKVTDQCRWFDPSVESVPDDSEAQVAVSWRASDVSFARAADVRDEIRDPVRYHGAKAGFQAVRVEGETTGTAAGPQGQPVVLWLIDLDAGTDDDGGVLIGRADADGGAGFHVATEALDRMAKTIVMRPPATDRFVVTRLEGGGTPISVTWEDSCFRLRAGAPDGVVLDEACDLAPPDDGVTTALLQRDDGLPVLAGRADPLAARATVPAASNLSGAVTTSTEGAALFAMPVRQPPFEVTVTDVTGDVIATERVAN